MSDGHSQTAKAQHNLLQKPRARHIPLLVLDL